MSLPQILPAQLPPQAYAHDNTADIASAPFRPIAGIGMGWVKPHAGTGLWTSPVIDWNADGTPADTEWLAWCREECSVRTHTHLTEVTPFADARILRIDDQADLIAIVETFPARYRFGTGVDDLYPDWSGLAEASWDAVYLTDRGQWATRLPKSGPNLYSWDMPSVLWLRPAFSVGRTVELAVAEAGEGR